jgi:pimeloyl-ACP methyl ester carboxylesterase
MEFPQGALHRSGLLILALLASAGAAHAKQSCTAPAGTVPIEFRSGENTLRGFLDKPPTSGKHPLILILHGSGSTNVMSGDGGYNSSYDELRAAFRRAGFASAVWDKAGSGCSDGHYSTWTPLVERTDEAIAALDALKTRDDVDATRVGLWAISEGAWAAPMAAVRKPEIAFLILVSAPVGDAPTETEYLAFNRLTQSGVSVAEAKQAVAVLRRAYLIAAAGGSHAEFLAAIEPLEKYPVFGTELRITETPEMKTAPEAAANYRTNQQSRDYVLRADAYLRELRQPTLAIWGGRDVQVDWRTSERVYREAFAAGGNSALTMKVFPEAGHNLYGTDSTFVKGYVELMVEWLTLVWPPAAPKAPAS